MFLRVIWRNRPVVTKLPILMGQVSFVPWADVCEMLGDDKRRSLHDEVIETFHKGPFELSHQVNKSNQKGSWLCSYSMNDDTVVNSKPIFNELEDLLTNLCIEVHLIYLLVPPVKTQIVDAYGWPMVWYLRVWAIYDFLDLIHWDEL